jgi:hypothetical protein
MKQCQVDLTGFSKAILESEGYIEVNNLTITQMDFKISLGFEFNGSSIDLINIASTLLESEVLIMPFSLKHCRSCQTGLNDVNVKIQFINMQRGLSFTWYCNSLRVYGVI